MDEASLGIEYGSGLRAEGPVVIDEASIGGIVVPKMPFGVVQTMD